MIIIHISILLITGCASNIVKHGYIDTTGNYIVEPVYDEINPFSEGLAAVKIKDKWGFIDTEGKVIIKPQFLNVEPVLTVDRGKFWLCHNVDLYNFNNGLAKVLMRFKYGDSYYEKFCFIDKTGNFPIKATFDVNSIFYGKIAAVSIYSKSDATYSTHYDDISFINNEGDIITEKWNIATFSNGIVNVKSSLCKIGFIDKSGNIVIEPKFDSTNIFSNGLAAVKIGKGWGYIDTTGNIVIPPIFTIAKNFSKGVAIVKWDKWYLFNKQGKVLDKNGEWNSFNISTESGGEIISISKSEIDVIISAHPHLTTNALPFDDINAFKEGLAAVKIKKKWGFVNTSGIVVIEPKFNDKKSFFYFGPDYHFSEGLAAVHIQKKWCFIDTTGEIVIKPQFNDANHFSEGLAGVKIKRKWGYIDDKGKFVTAFIFDDVEDFSEGLAAVKIKKKWGFINIKGEFIIQPKFDETWQVPNPYYFSESLSAVRINEKWGFINKKGEFIIEPKFDSAENFDNGLAKVGISLVSE